MAGRPKLKNPSRKIEPTISADMFECLAALVDEKTYGANPTEVARYLIQRGLDDLVRCGVLKRQPKGE